MTFRSGDKVEYIGHTKKCRHAHPDPDGVACIWDAFLGEKGIVFDPNQRHDTVGVHLANGDRYGYRSHFKLIKKGKGK